MRPYHGKCNHGRPHQPNNSQNANDCAENVVCRCNMTYIRSPKPENPRNGCGQTIEQKRVSVSTDVHVWPPPNAQFCRLYRQKLSGWTIRLKKGTTYSLDRRMKIDHSNQGESRADPFDRICCVVWEGVAVRLPPIPMGVKCYITVQSQSHFLV